MHGLKNIKFMSQSNIRTTELCTYPVEFDTVTIIHLVICLTTGPKRALHIVRSRSSSFKRECPLLSLRSSNSFLRLLPHLPVTSISPFIFPSIRVTISTKNILNKLKLMTILNSYMFPHRGAILTEIFRTQECEPGVETCSSFLLVMNCVVNEYMGWLVKYL